MIWTKEILMNEKEDLDTLINKWITEHPNVKIIDIKYTGISQFNMYVNELAHGSEGESEFFSSALIIYDED